MAGLYTALANRPGADHNEMTQSAEQRHGAMEELEARASTLGAELGMSQAQVDARLAQAHERVRRDSVAGDFRQFALRMAGESDRCVGEIPELLGTPLPS